MPGCGISAVAGAESELTSGGGSSFGGEAGADGSGSAVFASAGGATGLGAACGSAGGRSSSRGIASAFFGGAGFFFFFFGVDFLAGAVVVLSVFGSSAAPAPEAKRSSTAAMQSDGMGAFMPRTEARASRTLTYALSAPEHRARAGIDPLHFARGERGPPRQGGAIRGARQDGGGGARI